MISTRQHELPAAEVFRFVNVTSRGSRYVLATCGNGDLMETRAHAHLVEHAGVFSLQA